MQPHDVVGGGTPWLDFGTLRSRRGDSKTAAKGLIVTEERKIEEIRVGLCHKRVSFCQESAGIGLGILGAERPPGRTTHPC